MLGIDDTFGQRAHWIDGQHAPRDTPLDERLALLTRLCDVLDGDRRELATIITAEVGAPVSISGPMHVGLTTEILRAFVKLGQEFQFVTTAGSATLFHEPIGVAGCITPWNLPLILIAQKLGAALVTGCTTVFKPSELTPYSALRLGECMAELATRPASSTWSPATDHPPVKPWSAIRWSVRSPSRARRRQAAASPRWPPGR